MLKVVHIKYKLGRGGVIRLPVSLDPIFPFCFRFLVVLLYGSGDEYVGTRGTHISTTSVFVLYVIVTRSPIVVWIHMTPPKRRGHGMNTTVRESLLIHG